MLLISQGFLTHVKKANLIGSKSSTRTTVAPLQWNSDLDCFHPSDGLSFKLRLTGQVTVGGLICLIQILHILGWKTTGVPEADLESICQSFCCFIAYSAAVGLHPVILSKGKDLASLINGLIQMENQATRNCEFNLKETKKSFAQKIPFFRTFYKYQSELELVTGITVGVVSALIPTFPFNCLFFLGDLETNQRNVLEAAGERLGLFLVNWVVYDLTAHNVFLFIVVIGTSLNCLVAALYRFRSLIKKAVQNQSDTALKSAISLYRKLQILSCLFGEIHRLILAHLLLGLIFGGQVVPIFMLVKMSFENGAGGGKQLALTMFYIVVLLEGVIVVLGLYGLMGELHHISGLVREDANRMSVDKKGANRRHIFFLVRCRALLRTCPDLRIKMASCNYLETTTPLKFEEQAIDCTVNLLLI